MVVGCPSHPKVWVRAHDASDEAAADRWAPHDIPSAVELLDAVREFLQSDVLPATEGRVRFHTRVAANVVAMVAREVALGPEQRAAHAARLEGLGVHSDAELAAAIRSGAFDDRLPTRCAPWCRPRWRTNWRSPTPGTFETRPTAACPSSA